MNNISPFMDLGWYVVPLDGSIKRKKDGTKTTPIFKGKWKELYYDNPYEGEPSNLGAVICDKSGIISVDCDDEATYQLFKSLDPKYDFAFVSKDKPSGGASIIYKLPEDLKDTRAFRIHDSTMQLDFQTGPLLQFLPTTSNESKEDWKAETFADLPTLKEPPLKVVQLLNTISNLYQSSKSLTTSSGDATVYSTLKHYKHLAPFLDGFLSTQQFNDELFRILTPKSLQGSVQYMRERTLHPNNVPDGKGNEYITCVAGVLVCDASVSPSLFKKFMIHLNTMWDRPYSREAITKIIEYQVNRKLWVYDEDWKDRVSLILTEYNTLVKVFYDPITRLYYTVDSVYGMSVFNNVDTIPKHLNSIVEGTRRYKTPEIYNYLEKRQIIVSAKEAFGDSMPDDDDAGRLVKHNVFQRSKAYAVLLEPELYKEEFEGKVPHTTIAFFKHLIPDDDTREYVIRFILTKLRTMNFSEVILYFLGKTGAGKNLFVDWLAKITENKANTSTDYQMVVEVDLENFLSKYNLWIVNALFANLDEYGEKTQGSFEDRKVLAQLKSYTGKENIQLRTMNTDPQSTKHKCTFILTANENRLSPDLEDRRIVLIDTPDMLSRAKFVVDAGGKSQAIETMFNEVELWCYYWATNYKELSADAYRTPPVSKFKQDLILSHLPPSKKIAAIIADQNLRMLVQIMDDNDMIKELTDDAPHGAISKKTLVALFEVITEGTSARKPMLDRALRELDLEPSRIRFGKRSDMGYNFHALRKWSETTTMKDGDIVSKEDDEDNYEVNYVGKAKSI